MSRTLRDWWIEFGAKAGTITATHLDGSRSSFRQNPEPGPEETFCDLWEVIDGELSVNGCWDLVGTSDNLSWFWDENGSKDDFRHLVVIVKLNAFLP